MTVVLHGRRPGKKGGRTASRSSPGTAEIDVGRRAFRIVRQGLPRLDGAGFRGPGPAGPEGPAPVRPSAGARVSVRRAGVFLCFATPWTGPHGDAAVTHGVGRILRGDCCAHVTDGGRMCYRCGDLRIAKRGQGACERPRAPCRIMHCGDETGPSGRTGRRQNRHWN